MNLQQKELPISKNLQENQEYLKELLGLEKTFDIIVKDFNYDGHKMTCYGVNGFIGTDSNVKIIQDIASRISKFAKENPSFNHHDLIAYLNSHIAFVQVSIVKNMDAAVFQFLSGPIVVFIDGYDMALAIDTRNYPSRGPSEPEVERVVRGPRDGFTESLVTNITLTRRRLRDPKLRMEVFQVGVRSKTDVCVAYIEDLTNTELVEQIKTGIRSIRVDGIPMAEQSLEELLTGPRWNPYPLVRYTERPDVASIFLLQGHILIFVDTTPEVIIAPTTFFDHLHHPADYHQRPAVGTYVRWTILLAVILSIFLPAVWLELALHPKYLPKFLSFIGPVKNVKHISLPWQLFLGEIGIDLLRRAVINTPVPVASAIGIVSGLVFGQFTVTIGLMSPEALVYTALATIGSYATSSPELANANRLSRVVLIILVGCFHLIGLIAGVLFLIILLASTKTFGIPYFYPLIPFSWKGLKRALIREPVSEEKTRPNILRPQDKKKK